MGCATGIVKYLVFLANLIFALAGLALIIIGILYKFNYNEATNALPSDFGLAPILSIIIGAIVFITAFLGCCGAVKESPCMLTTYAIILLTIFIIQVAIGVYAFLKIKDTNQFHYQVRENLQKTFDSAKNGKQEAKEAVNVIQRFLECCGLDNLNEMTLPNGSLPLSCCKTGVQSCRSTDYNSVYNRGCSYALNHFLESSSQVIGGVAIGVAVIEFSCCGVDGPDYYYPNSTLPVSCCREGTEICHVSDSLNVFHEGCVQSIIPYLESSSQVIGGVAIGIAAIEILGAFFGLCLASSLKNQYRRSLYA